MIVHLQKHPRPVGTMSRLAPCHWITQQPASWSGLSTDLTFSSLEHSILIGTHQVSALYLVPHPGSDRPHVYIACGRLVVQACIQDLNQILFASGSACPPSKVLAVLSITAISTILEKIALD